MQATRIAIATVGYLLINWMSSIACAQIEARTSTSTHREPTVFQPSPSLSTPPNGTMQNEVQTKTLQFTGDAKRLRSQTRLSPNNNTQLDESTVAPASHQHALISHSSSESASAQSPSKPKLTDRIPLPKSDAKTGLPVSQSKSGWKSLITTLSALLVVIGIFVGFAALTRKTWTPGRSTIPKQVFEVIGQSTIAPRQQILLMRFGNKVLLVNRELGNVQTLSEIEDPVEVDRLVGLCEQQTTNSLSTTFGSVLSQVIQGGTDSSHRVRRSLFQRLPLSQGKPAS